MNIKKFLPIAIGLVSIGVEVYNVFSNKEPKKYSKKWFENSSNEVLNIERETIRKQYCSSGDDFSKAIELKSLLHQFDSELRKIAWGNEIPRGTSYHREHGYNLYKKD